eukprot:4525423-Pyramimonas_sp.AAC.1
MKTALDFKSFGGRQRPPRRRWPNMDALTRSRGRRMRRGPIEPTSRSDPLPEAGLAAERTLSRNVPHVSDTC